MDIYGLSRNFWDFSFENPEKVKPIHSAILFFAIEHCNRLSWKEKFGFPTSMAMEAIGISNYASYKKGLEELVEWGFIKMVQVSKNQYSANIISLIQFVGSTDKALDKALIKHSGKQHIKHTESIASIDKQIYNSTNLQDTSIQDTTIVVGSDDLITTEKIDNRNLGTQRIIDIVQSEIQNLGYLYEKHAQDRNRATIIAKRYSDWGDFIKDSPEAKEEQMIRQIIIYSNSNEFVKKIRSVYDFHEKWKSVANSMKQSIAQVPVSRTF